MGKGGFGKGKYKRIIKSIYPTSPDGDVQVHNIGKLVHFCQISPTKLIKVARYVEKKTNSDLTKSKLRFVGASMKIFQDLIKGCRKNLNLFSNNVLRLVKLLLECSFPKLKMIATDTFIQFTEVLDENTPYPELEGLIKFLIDMCHNLIRDSHIRFRLKEDGLKDVRVLEMTDELDGFIARNSDADNWDALLPAILDNLSFSLASNHSEAIPFPATVITDAAEVSEHHEEANTISEHSEGSRSLEEDRESIHILATDVLRDIFSRANISITSLFKAILRYLEAKNRWIPSTFAVHCIQSIYDCLKMQHGQILITLLLQHAELPHHSIQVKSQIFGATVQFFTESTGYFMQILDSLVKHLVSSVEFNSQDELVVENANAHLRFQDDMIVCLGKAHSCLGVLCTKISQQQKQDAFNALAMRLSQSKHVSSSGLSGVVVIFSRAILQVTHSLQNFPIDLLVPYLRLFQELSMHNNADVRIYVQKIFQTALMPPLTQHNILTNPSLLKSNLTIEDTIPEQVVNAIRGTLYFQIKMRMKQAENYVTIFNTLKIMLYRGYKYDFVESFPLVFSIQKFASKWKKLPPIRAYTIHALVAAYLYCVAHIFCCKALEHYIDQTLLEREKKGQQCTAVTLQKAPIPALLLRPDSEYSHTLQKKVAVDYVLFDRQAVVDLLCAEGGSTLSNEKRLPKILMKKYKQQNDTLTLSILTTSPSSVFSILSESTISLPAIPLTGSATHPELEISDHVAKSVIVFSPENGSDLLEKYTLQTKIDVRSMKQALVTGRHPFSAISQKHSFSYDTLVTNLQKTQNEKKSNIALSTNNTIGQSSSWSIFEAHMDLLCKFK